MRVKMGVEVCAYLCVNVIKYLGTEKEKKKSHSVGTLEILHCTELRQMACIVWHWKYHVALCLNILLNRNML